MGGAACAAASLLPLLEEKEGVVLVLEASLLVE